jgi:predicted enzyme related to lactoylglutathione lyase
MRDSSQITLSYDTKAVISPVSQHRPDGRETTMRPEDMTRRAALGLAAGAAMAAQANAMGLNPKGEQAMERVTGIGGFFFRAKDPKALAKWYNDNLGVTKTPSNYDDPPWRQGAGTTVFEPFKHDTTYFGDMRLQWMINFRVRDLDKMAAQLRANGVAVDIDPETYPNGRFAKIVDPEGNPIQLWQSNDPSDG